MFAKHRTGSFGQRPHGPSRTPHRPDVYEAATKAANAAYPDPRTACLYARRALELVVSWAFKSDASLRLPIAKRFDKNYPHHNGTFARIIHHGVTYAQNLIDDSSDPSKPGRWRRVEGEGREPWAGALRALADRTRS